LSTGSVAVAVAVAVVDVVGFLVGDEVEVAVAETKRRVVDFVALRSVRPRCHQALELSVRVR